MEAYKEEQLLALLDAKKDEFCTANNNDCKSCLMEDGAGHCNIVNMAWNLLRADKKMTGKDRGKTYKTPI